jgi:thioredoxin 1
MIPSGTAPNGVATTSQIERKNMNEPININEASFEKAVLKSPIPVLVDFWAPWCGPCKMIGPLLDEIAKENGDRFRIAKVNIDDDPALMQRFNVRAVPTLLIFKGGEVRDQLVGAVPKKAIVEKLEALVAADSV